MNQAELTFVKNHSIRKVFIKNGIINLITPEMSYTPIPFDKAKYMKLINSKESKKIADLSYEDLVKLRGEKQAQVIVEFAEEINKKRDIDFNDTESLKNEIIKDFQDSGWRCIKQ